MEEGLNAKGVKGDIGVEIWPGGGEGWREGWVGGWGDGGTNNPLFHPSRLLYSYTHLFQEDIMVHRESGPGALRVYREGVIQILIQIQRGRGDEEAPRKPGGIKGIAGLGGSHRPGQPPLMYNKGR